MDPQLAFTVLNAIISLVMVGSTAVSAWFSITMKYSIAQLELQMERRMQDHLERAREAFAEVEDLESVKQELKEQRASLARIEQALTRFAVERGSGGSLKPAG